MGNAPGPQVRIFYTRPPNPPDVFVQAVVHESSSVIVTLGVDLELPGPKHIDDQLAMEPGGSIVWFTFPGEWHDIGKSYLRDGTFAGTYANVLTPVEIEPAGVWRTTDLCLDVWLPPQGEAVLLDADALETAVSSGSIPPHLATRAEREAEKLLDGASRGSWPPGVVREWTLERALAVLQGG